MQTQGGQDCDREKHDETKAKEERSAWSRAPRRSASSDGKVRCRTRMKTPERTLSRTTSPRSRARVQTSSFSSVRAQRQTRSWPQLLEEYKAAVARSEATKVSLEDQAQMAASAETETQQAQHTVSQVEFEAVKDAANVEQAVKAQEDAKVGEAAVSSKAASAREAASDAERDLDDARSSEASQQTEYEYTCSPEREYPVWIGESSSSSSTTFQQCGPRRERETHEQSQSKES